MDRANASGTSFLARLMAVTLCAISWTGALEAQPKRLTLQELINPSARFYRDREPVRFALHGFLEFETLQELFTYIDGQAGRWQFASEKERQDFAGRLLARGIESRVVSMVYEEPLEVIVTHTAEELELAISGVRTPAAPLIFQGRHWRLTTEVYAQTFLRTQANWKTSLNCWSASPSIPGRVLSNWYLIEEGIPLFGSVYDSTEHFWQAVKYHPDTRVSDLLALLDEIDKVDWSRWLQALANDQKTYLTHTYAVEFLRHILSSERRAWFRQELKKLDGAEFARRAQQRDPSRSGAFRFAALQEKELWGDLADVFHLIYFFSHLGAGRFRQPEMQPLPEALRRFHFDAVYLAGYGTGKMGFISPEFQQLMLEIWKVKYLQMKRFREVIRSTRGVRLEHFLNDGDSPDIPIHVYVRFLNQIREMAFEEP